MPLRHQSQYFGEVWLGYHAIRRVRRVRCARSEGGGCGTGPCVGSGDDRPGSEIGVTTDARRHCGFYLFMSIVFSPSVYVGLFVGAGLAIAAVIGLCVWWWIEEKWARDQLEMVRCKKEKVFPPFLTLPPPQGANSGRAIMIG